MISFVFSNIQYPLKRSFCLPQDLADYFVTEAATAVAETLEVTSNQFVLDSSTVRPLKS